MVSFNQVGDICVCAAIKYVVGDTLIFLDWTYLFV